MLTPSCLRLAALLFLLLGAAALSPAGDPAPAPAVSDAAAVKQTAKRNEANTMLGSLILLQENLDQQIDLVRKQLKAVSSEAEKERLTAELQRLDNQRVGASNDFERIATGIDAVLFEEKKGEDFDWKEEMSTLLKPLVMELKRLTIRARQKTQLMDTVNEYDRLEPVALEAVGNIEALLKRTEEKAVRKRLSALLPEWKNIHHRIENKLRLARMQLAQMEEQEVSLVDASSDSMRRFFRTRGLYLLIAVLTVAMILLAGKLVYMGILRVLERVPAARKPFYLRLLYLLFRVATMLLAVFGFVVVLYQAEDWLLLSITIIFFVGLGWTVRQGLPRLWQQARLMANAGAVREGERMVLHGVPWRVESLHVFCGLYNPALDLRLRLPIEALIGQISRPCRGDEPWFPCKRGDWVLLADGMRGKVIHCTHEAVELVERGGAHRTYQTGDFLGLSPVNLSRNFRLRVPFGITYNQQARITEAIPAMLQNHIQERAEAEGYGQDLISLRVEFMQAGASSLDLLVLADFLGEQAPLYQRLTRAIQRWCVEACTINGWEIPFPQLTVHRPASSGAGPLPDHDERIPGGA